VRWLESMQTLQVATLVLEPLRTAHAEAMFALLSDPELYRHLDSGPPLTIEHLRATYARLEVRRSPDGAQHWLNWVLREATHGVVGYVQATVEPSGDAWVAFVIGRRYQGRGDATRATACMLEHLAVAYGVRRFLATVEQDNRPSIGVLRRLGFVEATAEQAAGRWPSPTERLFVREAATTSR